MSEILTEQFEPVYYREMKHHATGEPLPGMLAGGIEPNPEAVGEINEDNLHFAARSLRACLKFDESFRPWESTEAGNCYSFAWNLADITEEELGGRAMIAYCSGHTFNIVHDSSSKIHMIHSDTREDMWFFDLKSTKDKTGILGEKLLERIESNPDLSFATGLLSKKNIVEEMGVRDKQAVRMLPRWLHGSKSSAVTVMGREYGKKALKNYGEFEDSLDSQDIETVSRALNNLQIYNPDNETRPAHNPNLKKFRRCVKEWAKDDSVDEDFIRECVSLYKSVLPTKNKLANQIFGDCCRDACEYRGSQSLAEDAEEYYTAAAEYGREDPVLLAKWKKLREIRPRQTATA